MDIVNSSVRPLLSRAPDGWSPSPLPPTPTGFTDVEFSIPLRTDTPRLLECIHPHPLDKSFHVQNGLNLNLNLNYVDEFQCSGSVTTLCHSHALEFDEMATVAKMKRGENWPRPEYTHHRRLPLVEAAAILFEAGVACITHSVDDPQWAHWIDIVTQLVLGPYARHPDPDTGEMQNIVVKELCLALQNLRRDSLHSSSFPAGIIAGIDAAVHKVALSDDDIRKVWRAHREDAANRGTWLHLQLELWLNRDPSYLGGTELYLFTRYVKEHLEPLHVEAFRTEWKVFARPFDIAGSIDFVGRFTQGPLEGQLIIVDWKRSKDLHHQPVGKGRMRPPLDHIPDSKIWSYALQLNVYALILEQFYSYKVAHLEVVCIHESLGDTPLVVRIPRIPVATEYLMQWHKHRCKLGMMRCDPEDGGVECTSLVTERVLPPLEFIQFSSTH